ncbi:succinate dehydrogenase, cytochrome b556 subunit [Natrinema ejinorense]|uniref:Succinate dehydrogenase, cytochrome b556 subunit n=1 Tax=Natrinema ejinorense TaxID=373386 RepID=A0A2A5QRZ1_9EURY|nr:succinate dehydrogenase, cytochrome b556 subunit [Natrinema ejinorense]PCR89574.1 succinate dehydrogenase, cytochrome b556 subunit [Natrinema ejinorense]
MSNSYNRGVVEDFGRWKEFSAGMWAWILHKFSGWILIGYLFMHIPVLSTSIGAVNGDPAAIQQQTDVYTQTVRGLEGLFIIRLMEVGLLSVAVFHILNGVRLLMVDLGVGLDSQDKSFYASVMLTGAITVASVPTFVSGVGI